MRLRHPDGTVVHLGYGTNVLPAEDVDGLVAQATSMGGRIRRSLGAMSTTSRRTRPWASGSGCPRLPRTASPPTPRAYAGCGAGWPSTASRW